MTGLLTSAGRAMRDDDRQHSPGCWSRRPNWCWCGQTENIVAVESEAAALERKRIRDLLLEPYANKFWREIPDAINEAVASLDDGAELPSES